eukprot:scaffold2584_cov164-Alexandrium_tamarense.AAC.13
MIEGVRKCRLASLSHQHLAQLNVKEHGLRVTLLASINRTLSLTADQAVTVCQTLNADEGGEKEGC